MNKIRKMFEDKKVRMGFLTAGENGLNHMGRDLCEMEAEGFDIIELGMPFSDPAAEGKEIQDNNVASLREGCTADIIFDVLEDTRGKRKSEIILNLYMNTAYRYGFDAFLTRCKKAGVTGLIVQDLPFEERDELRCVAEKYAITVISIAAEAPDERIAKIARKAQDFICISPSVMRGQEEKKPGVIRHMIEVIRKENDIPVIVGIDAADEMSIQKYSALGDGVRIRYQVYQKHRTVK